MILNELILENFGPFSGRQTVQLRPSSPSAPVVVIGGRNGEGKTTLLEGLLLALYGPRSSMAPTGRTSYGSYLKSLVNHGADEEASAGVELSFELGTESGPTEVRIRRSWHGRSSSVAPENVEVWRDGEPDPALAGRLADFVESVVPRGVAPLFFFDGERIEELAEVENAASAVRSALDALLGLELVEQLSQDLATVERRQADATSDNEEAESLDEIETEIQELYTQSSADQMAAAEAKSSLDSALGRLERIQDEFRHAGGAAYLERSGREAEMFSARTSLERERERLREVARGAAPLLLLRSELERISDAQAEQERKAEGAKFAQAIEARDAETVAWLREEGSSDVAYKLAEYLAEDRRERSAVLESDGSPERQLVVSGLRALVNERFPGISHSIADGLRSIEASKGRLHDAEQLLAEVPPEEKIAEVLARLNDAKASVEDAEFRHQRAVRQLGSSRAEAERAVARRAKILEDIARRRGEADRHARILAYASRARATLDALRTRATEHNLARIETLVLDSLNVLLRKDGLIRNVKIDPISSRLTLFGKEGRIVRPPELSAGERQLVALALMWGLARCAEGSLPVVIDTPLGRLDSEHRALFAKHYLPAASHQVIVLSTDTEIDAGLMEFLGAHVSHTLRLRHSEDEQSTQVEDGYFEAERLVA